MNDQHKPLTAAENDTWSGAETSNPYSWAIIGLALHCQHRREEKCAVPFGEKDAKCSFEGCPMRPQEYPELFEPTPPTDAEVREAVEEVLQELGLPPCWCEGSGADELDGTGPCFFEVEEKHLRILLRAVQAPHLGLSALLPDDFSDSKDWRDGDPAERIEWLKSMLTAMREREADAWKQGELSPRLTPEQVEAVKNINRKTESRQCICGDGYLCARCEILGELTAAFPEVFGKEG